MNLLQSMIRASIGADVVGGAVATVTDFGASVWNSLTPSSMNVATEDLLTKMDSNALRVYEENPDTVKTASFVGGIFVPSTLALKGMGLARAGVRGANWFSEAGQVAQKTKVAAAFAEAGVASATYKKTVNGLYAMSAANMLVDTVAAEAAMVIAMNAHPYMEDYMEDLPKNFMTSVGLGLGVGAGIGHILDRAAVKGIKMGIEKDAMDIVRKGYDDVSTIENISGQMAQRSRNVENWENILKSSKAIPEQTGAVGPVRDLNNFTKNMLETFVMKERASIVDDFERMASPEIRALDADKRANIINMITGNPARFSGIDNIRFATAVEDLPAVTKAPRNLVEDTKTKPGKIGEENKDLELPLTEKNKKAQDVGVTMIYSPKFDAFMLQSDLKHYGTAVDFVQDEKKLTERLQNNWHLVPRYDQTLEATRMTTSAVDADYLTALKYYDELPIDAFKKATIAVSPDDTSVLNAIYARISKEIQKDPSLVNELKVTTGKDKEVLDAMGVYEKLIDGKQNQINSLLSQGVPPQTISLHTNVPLETIEAYMVSANKDLVSLGLPASSYSNASEIGMYLDPTKRSLAINTNLNKVPTSRMKNTIQKRIFDSLDMDVKTAMLAGSKSQISRDISTYLTSDNISTQLNVLTAEINRVTDSGVGGKMFTSTDFALRDLGAVGAIASAIGKDTQELINRAVSKIWEPMKPSFTSISKDPAALVELNTAMKVQASLPGYIEFRGNKFFQQSKENPWNIIKDPKTGKVLSKERNMVEVDYNGRPFVVQTPAVKEALSTMQASGRELYEMRNSLNSISGRPPINDRGFWSPPLNPKTKLITYVWDKVEDKTTLLFGKNQEELQTAVNAWKSKIPPGDIGRRYEIVDKSNQALYNKIQGRHDPIFMESADSGMMHSGSSASEIVSTNADVLVDLANGYDHYVGYGIRSMLDVQLSNVMQKMDQLSYLSQQSYRDQPLNLIQKMIQKPKDPGAIMRNTLMGNSNLNQSVFWEKLSDVSGGVSEFGLTTINNLMEPILSKTKSIFGKGKGASDKDYLNLINELKVRGIDNPFEAMDDHLAKEMFHVQSISQAPNMTPRILALSNSLAATSMLKFMELAQPYVNAISLPILTAGAMGRKMERSFMGAALDPKAKFGVAATMYNGIRFGGSVEGKALNKLAEEAGLFKSIVSEANEVMSQARSLDKGMITAVEKGLEKVNASILVAPANYSESLVRKLAFQTGAYMAKESYPGISKAGIMTFARDFMDQAIGNYASAQRPVMFQGTLGVAIGLFQTYMLTTAQDIYRLVENRNFKQLGKMMLAQGTIFGARSLPGFSYVSETIGEHFSDQNIDLTTGLYRALPHELADLIIYGLPSNLGPAITTRGEIQPRVPNILGEGINAIPAFNLLKQAYQAGDRVASAAFTANASTGRAMLEALSLQSISRPIARMSEMLSGNAITGAGNLVSGPDDVWTWRSAGARAMATRPLEEVKAREAIHLNSFYGSIDREKRQETVKTLRTHIRDNNLNPEIVEKLGNDYMRTGSPSGWRSAVNTAIAQTQTTSGNTVRNYLKPNSPFFKMIDDLE